MNFFVFILSRKIHKKWASQLLQIIACPIKRVCLGFLYGIIVPEHKKYLSFGTKYDSPNFLLNVCS